MVSKSSITLIVLFLIQSIVYCFNVDETIQVYYVEAPLLKSQFGDLLANINAYHSGLYFYTMETHEEYTIDFLAYPSILATFFPTITNNTSNNTIDIVWNTRGLVQYQELYNTTYWTRSNLSMTITGRQFQNYLCWIPYYNQTYDYYNLFDVREYQSNDLYIPSSICNDFVWSSFQTLYDLGGQVVTQVSPQRDFATLYVDENPTLVQDPQDPDSWSQLTNFYINLVGLTHNQTADELVQHIITLFGGRFFLYIDGNYFNMSLSNTPQFEYLPQSMPAGDRDPYDIQYAPNCLPNYPSPKSSIGGGWIFVIVLSCLIVCYVGFGMIYNMKAQGKRGLDSFPNKDSWSKLLVMIGDGVSFIRLKISPSSSSYSSLN